MGLSEELLFMKYSFKCGVCGKVNNVNINRVWFNEVFREKNTYVKCNQCQHVTSIKLCYHVVKDNVDKKLKKKNMVKVLQEWKQC